MVCGGGGLYSFEALGFMVVRVYPRGLSFLVKILCFLCTLWSKKKGEGVKGFLKGFSG